MKPTFYQRIGKRLFDLALVVPLMLLLAPVLAVTALLVRVCLGSPVIFRQQRPGRGGQPFWVWKFRTMTDAVGDDGELLPDDQRLTRFGRLLRSTSLDELPELWNVLRGEMSFVGPRPLMMDYLPHYTPRQMRRHDVPPGITGWAQIKGRNAISWDERFELDLWYVENQSFLLDLKILLLTPGKVLRREGVSAAGHATMPRFDAQSTEGSQT